MPKDNIFVAMAIVIALAALIMSFSSHRDSSVGGTRAFSGLYGGDAVSTTVDASTTAYEILAASATRQYASICNATLGNTNISLHFKTSGQSTSTGYVLFPNTCYIIDHDNPYVGAVWAIATTTVTLHVLYK